MAALPSIWIATTLLGVCFADPHGPAPQREIRFAPDLELPTIDGQRTIRLSELRGRKLLLVEFASW